MREPSSYLSSDSQMMLLTSCSVTCCVSHPILGPLGQSWMWKRSLRISQDVCRVDSMMSTLRTLLDTGTGLQEVFNECLKPVITKLSRGITATPDELLVLIFNLVGRRDGTKQAVRLSHVSRKFRAIALGEKYLWTTLHSRASKDELEALISRSGQVVDLHVVIHVIAEVTFNLQAFMDICFPTAPRWKSLAVIEVSHFEYGDQRGGFGPEDDESLL